LTSQRMKEGFLSTCHGVYSSIHFLRVKGRKTCKPVECMQFVMVVKVSEHRLGIIIWLVCTPLGIIMIIIIKDRTDFLG